MQRFVHSIPYTGHLAGPGEIMLTLLNIKAVFPQYQRCQKSCEECDVVSSIEKSASSLCADDASAESSDEGSEEPEADEEEQQPAHDITVKTTEYDARFPSYNQARHCYTRYNEYHRCISVDGKSEDDPECKSYQRAYRSMCPMEWVNSWNEQREAGTWPGKY